MALLARRRTRNIRKIKKIDTDTSIKTRWGPARYFQSSLRHSRGRRVISLEVKQNNENALPFVLAGPILRRVEPHRVCIWVATSRPANIRAEIFRLRDLEAYDDQQNEKQELPRPIGTGSTQALQLGERLFISLVMAYPVQDSVISPANDNSSLGSGKKASFPTDELLAYDIIFDDSTNLPGLRLKDLGLLDGERSIAYQFLNKGKESQNNGTVLLPTFFLRGETSPLHILYGSCRKLHGDGEDSLVAADELIASSVKDLDKRPSLLYLIGDQIYADDVAGPLIRHLTSLGISLLGWEEQIQDIGKKLTEIQIGERQQLVKEYAKFSSDKADNHLFSLGEFAAMYLVAWNEEIWPKNYPSVKSVPSHAHRTYRRQIQRLEQARKAMPAIRRLLANIPTYMICDDHEVTDDWNIDGAWHQAVKTSQCGKQIVTNALVAYWAFQAWGEQSRCI